MGICYRSGFVEFMDLLLSSGKIVLIFGLIHRIVRITNKKMI